MARTVRNVWLFVPNLIGYARFLLLLASLFSVLRAESTHLFLALYAASYLLDAADGPVARSLQQTSRFGAVLDMVTDRVSTAVLLAALAHESVASPARALRPWAPAWLGLLVLDIAAHWVQMYATLALGAASHKALPDEPALLTWYYRRANLFIVCLLSETHLVTAFTLSRGAAGVQVASIPLCVRGPSERRAQAFAAAAPLHPPPPPSRPFPSRPTRATPPAPRRAASAPPCRSCPSLPRSPPSPRSSRPPT
jgi:phosphatidylglycerophosphate synthase